MKKIFVITQCFPCGSWLCIEKIINSLSEKNYEISILGLGSPSGRLKKLKYHLVPFLEYTKFGNITCYSPVLGFLWNLPLYIFSLILTLFIQPEVMVYNGLTSGLILSPWYHFFGKKNIVMYHSVIGHNGKMVKAIIRLLMKCVDLVVVNSKTSKEDLCDVVEERKIIINEHYADQCFFHKIAKNNRKGNALRILYVGRIDKDKRCFPLIDFALKMKNNRDFEFTFAGSGANAGKVANLGEDYKFIKYKGYVGDKEELAELYLNADILWGFADTSYLGLPAVEALACGTPIVIPKYAAIADKDVEIDPVLVPSSIGWLVDPFDADNIEKTLVSIAKGQLFKTKKCREYAKEHYSIKNLIETVEKIEILINSQ
jgi:glycosyltransferase involved in cell wall biosynthesis